MKVIILEGENKTGKTTLAKEFQSHGFDYIKCSQPKGDPYIEYMNILKKIKKDTVIDRFAYGELVYGPLYRGESKLSNEQLRNIEMKVMALGGVLIYCTDNPKNIEKRFKQENEEFADVKKIKKTISLYNKIFDKVLLKKYKHIMMSEYDILTNSKIWSILHNIKQSWSKINNVIGNTYNPKLILVGDKRNIKANFEYNKIGQPFDFGKSSQFLFEAIERAGIPLKDIMILNSDNKDLHLLRLYTEATIVSLGAKANEKLNKLRIKNVKINHPSHESRFNHNNLNQYAKKLFKLYKGY